MERNFRILTLDGGGVRGIFGAKVLDLMQDRLGVNIYKSFDLIVGTSTGSIVAGAIATKYCMGQLIADYKELSHKIFHKQQNFSCGGFLRSKYNISKLQSFLKERYEDTTMGQIEQPLIINATNMASGKGYVIKSKYQKKYRPNEYNRDSETPLFRAISASCAAPSYFDPVNIGGELLCDGGIWANNPATVGYTDAIKTFKCNPEAIRILSLGTNAPVTYMESVRPWGLLTGWKGRKLVDFFLSCQTDTPVNIMSLILGNRLLRINAADSVGTDMALDNCQQIPILERVAQEEFRLNKESLKAFLM